MIKAVRVDLTAFICLKIRSNVDKTFETSIQSAGNSLPASSSVLCYYR